MLQALDTHRLMYRNAKLRAFLLDGDQNTTPAKFYDITGPLDVEHPIESYDCGYFVSTNEEGYICRESDQAIVRQLAVTHNVVIQVSLDGGQSWPIQWNVAGQDGEQFLQSTDIKSLWFYDADGNLKEYNPAVQEETLPDYVRRGEIDLNNIWVEETLIIEPGDTAIQLSKWTKSIIIPDDVNTTTRVLEIHNGAARAGQVVHIMSLSHAQVTLRLDSGLQYRMPNNIAPQNPSVSCTAMCVLVVNPNGMAVVHGILNGTTLRDAKDQDTLVSGYTYIYTEPVSRAFMISGTVPSFVFINASSEMVIIKGETIPAGAVGIYTNGVKVNTNSVPITPNVNMPPWFDGVDTFKYYVTKTLAANTINVINIDITTWTDKPGCSGSDETFNIIVPNLLGNNYDFDIIVNIKGTSFDSLPHSFTVNLLHGNTQQFAATLRKGCFVFEGDGLIKCRIKHTKDNHYLVWAADYGE